MLIYATAVMIVLLGLATLTVDYGLRSIVDRELQDAADAAAVAGTQRMSELSTALTLDDATNRNLLIRDAVIRIAESNRTTDGTIRCSAGDIEIGIWDANSRTFTPSASPQANAVRVTLERSLSRGNGIRTTVGRFFGVDQLTSRRRATACLERPPSYGIVGLDGFACAGVLTVDGAPLYRQGSIASNGDVTLNTLGLLNVSLIDGHIATPANVNLPWLLNLTVIRDGVQRPTQPFTLPDVTVQAPTRVNDNGLLGALLTANGDMLVAVAGDLPAGVYCVNNLTILAGAILRTHGDVTIFVKGNVSILGTVLALDNDPANFKVRVAGNGFVLIAAGITLSVDLYAPKSVVTIAVGVIYRGRLMAKRIGILGTSFFFLRPDLPPPELGRSRTTLVV